MASTTESADADVLVDVNDDGVCVLTFNRPAVRNAMSARMAAEYAAAMRAADDDPAVRVIILTGAGAGFCAGADLAVLREGGAMIRKFLPSREDLPQLTFDLRKPVIAAINGPAVGIGFAYAMGSDLRIATESAKIGTLFAQLGLVAEYGLSWLLPRVLGVQKAMDVLLSGRLYSGEEAARIGLVHSVVPDGTALSAAVAYATELARTCSPTSLAVIKKQVYADLDRSRYDALTDTLAKMDVSFDSPELIEALEARTEKRAAVFPPLPPRSDVTA